MYAVVKTGGKQYRVSPGDVMVVEKLAGEPGDNVAFGDVLMVGEGDAVVVGAPTVAGASVSATLIETRKGEKVKIFKKIRRQGYRRTRGHRQTETVLRVTALVGADGKETKWDGTVDMTTKAELNARARNLKFDAPAAAEAPKAKAAPAAEAKVGERHGSQEIGRLLAQRARFRRSAPRREEVRRRERARRQHPRASARHQVLAGR